MISDCDRCGCRSLDWGFVTSDCDRRGSLGCGGFVCVCLLRVLLTGVMGCGFMTLNCDRHGSLGCGGFLCVCVCVFCFVFCSPA